MASTMTNGMCLIDRAVLGGDRVGSSLRDLGSRGILTVDFVHGYHRVVPLALQTENHLRVILSDGQIDISGQSSGPS